MSPRGTVYLLLFLYVGIVTLLLSNYRHLSLSFNTYVFQETRNGVLDAAFPLHEEARDVVEVEDQQGDGPHASLVKQFLAVRPGNKYIPEFVLNDANVCKGADSSSVAVVVPTALGNAKSREFIRRTWGNTTREGSPFHAVLFLVGSSPDAEAMRDASIEHDRYQDLIQIDALDTYENLTYKSVAILAWANRYLGYV